MKTKIFKEVASWGKKVGPKIWSKTKDAPGKAKKFTTDQFSKMHQSETYAKASRAMSEMSAMQVREVGAKLTTKTGIGIMAGVGGGAAGYAVAKKKKKNRYS